MLPYFRQSFIKSMGRMGARNMLKSAGKSNELQEMKRLAEDRYLFWPEESASHWERNEGRRTTVKPRREKE